MLARSGGTAGLRRADVGRRLFLVLDQLLEHGPLGKRRPAGQHVEQGAAERVQVAPDVHVAGIARLLGADVVERPERHPALGQAVVAAALEPPRQAHVHQLAPAPEA